MFFHALRIEASTDNALVYCTQKSWHLRDSVSSHMEDPAKMELRHWTNFDQTCLKDYFRDQSTMKLAEVVAERDAAIAEREAALAEKKCAYAEKDAALIQRDMAYADRNAAWMERDSALAALSELHANDNNENAAKLIQIINFAMNRPAEGSDFMCLPNTGNGPGCSSLTKAKLQQDIAKHGFKQETKINKGLTKRQKPSELAKPPKEEPGFSSRQGQVQKAQEQRLVKSKSKQKDVSNNVVPYVAPYDMSITPIPFCSCTGNNQQCYRWGSGGWQSACCTNFLSLYPLPMNEAKRGCRLAGRKMSGGAFKKLLERLASNGVDITKPIDLKNHWARHGTNRYVTIK